MRKLLNLVESMEHLELEHLNEGFFDMFKSKPKPEPEPELSPEEKQEQYELKIVEFNKKQKSWNRAMLNAYKSLYELISFNQWQQIKGKSTLIKNKFKKGIKAGFIVLPTPEKEKAAVNAIERALNMKVFDEKKIDQKDFAGGGTGALLGFALGGPIGAALGGGIGSSRRAGKLSKQELAVANARAQTDQKRGDNKDFIINRLQKFQPRFEKLIDISNVDFPDGPDGSESTNPYTNRAEDLLQQIRDRQA